MTTFPLAEQIIAASVKQMDFLDLRPFPICIIANTRAGATCVNHTGIHFFNDNLPFGGANNSGIGKANGFFGFEAFSNARAVLKQWAPISGLDGMSPPYTSKKQKLIDLTIQWL